MMCRAGADLSGVASIDSDHPATPGIAANPFWPFTMQRAVSGPDRSTGINNLVASRTVEQSRGSKTE
jgi:hypothetical protein